MELFQLKYYKTIVEEGSINAAAKKMGLTQPPVSMQVKLLEAELGCVLFERGNRRIRLTEEGHILYQHAVRLLNMAESAVTAVTDCHTAVSGTLRVGVVSTLADLAARQWFADFSATRPLVNYELTEGNTYELLDSLKNREIDVALVRRPFSSRGLTCFPLEAEDLLLIGSEKYLATLPDPVPLRQAAALPLIVYRRWRDTLDKAFAANGDSPRFLCVADDARTCVSWASAGLGVAIAPSDIRLGWYPPSLSTRVVEGLPAMAQTTLAINASGCDTAVGNAFVRYLQETAGFPQ